MWVYEQLTGRIYHDTDSLPVGFGYSGAGLSKNNPADQEIHNDGPIPQGDWIITELIDITPTHGPYVLRLMPKAKTETFGRSGFLCHGDSKAHPGTASEGCIIQARDVREAIWNSGDRDLRVIDYGFENKHRNNTA